MTHNMYLYRWFPYDVDVSDLDAAIVTNYQLSHYENFKYRMTKE